MTRRLLLVAALLVQFPEGSWGWEPGKPMHMAGLPWWDAANPLVVTVVRDRLYGPDEKGITYFTLTDRSGGHAVVSVDADLPIAAMLREMDGRRVVLSMEPYELQELKR